MVGVIGKAIKGFGKALTKKRPKVKTYYRLKDDVVQKSHREKYNLDTLLNLITPGCSIRS